MDIYLVKKNENFMFLINPTAGDMAGADVIAWKLNITNLYQAGFDFVHQAAQMIYLESAQLENIFDKIEKFVRMADVFEVYVPGVLMLSWELARGYSEAEFTKYFVTPTVS